MGELSRYRLFLSFLAVPVVVVILIVVLLVNAFGDNEKEAAQGEQQTAVAEGEPTLAISVVTVAPAQTSPNPNATVTPTSTPLAIATPTNTLASPPVEPTPTTAAAPAPVSSTEPQEYEVQPNDTLSEIANSFGLTSAEVAEANQIENPDEIQVGDILIIPPAPAGREIAPAATPTPTPTPISATVDPDEGLNVREDPTTDSDVLEVLLGGAEILLTGTKQTIDEIEWVELVDGGWVQSQYLTIEGE